MVRLTGQVEAVNDKGVKIDGEWRNFSRYAKAGAIASVEPGVRVECQLDNAGFLRVMTLTKSSVTRSEPEEDINPADGTTADAPPVSLKDTFTMKDALILRQTCIKAAAEFAAGRPDIKSSDVLKIAECWERWIVR